MISPTGLGVRNDQAGFGFFDAPRGSKAHNGVDFLCNPGTEVVFPFDSGRILRLSYPYADSTELGGVYGRATHNGKLVYFKLWYFQPQEDILQRALIKGEQIGIAQDVTVRYPDHSMHPHLHLKIEKIDPEILLEEDL